MSTQPQSGPGPWQTGTIGNTNAGTAFDNKSTTSTVRVIGVRWDGDKVRGIRIELYDGTSWQYGGYDDTGYTLTTYVFTDGESLKTLTLRDSGYGYRSVRQILFSTSNSATFSAGPGGFDNEIDPDVEHRVFVGFYGTVNPDNFINSLGFWIQRPPS